MSGAGTDGVPERDALRREAAARPVMSLTARLGLAVALILTMGGAAVMVAALAYGHQAAREAFDRLLVGAAGQIAASVKVLDGELVTDIPTSAFELLALAREDRVAYRVIGLNGETLTGDDDLPPPPDPRAEFYEVSYRGEPFRLAVARRRFAERRVSGAVTVVAGHTKRARDALAWEIAGSAMVVLGAAGLGMIGLAGFAIHSAMQPLRRIESALAARAPEDLTPLEVPAPRETRGAVAALNRFMARVDAQMGATGRLIADSAHQLRTPVAALRAQAELAAEESDSARLREIVARIHARAVGLGRLTDQLLNRALVIHRADAAPRAILDLRTVAMRTVEESDHDAGATAAPRAAELRLDLPEEPVWTRGDALSLVEACKNLVNNALRHGAAPVTLAVAQEGGRALVVVRDRGPGLPPERWEQAGERFERGSAADSAGLGLSIVRAVAQAHRGELRFGRDAAGGFEAGLALPAAPEPRA